MEIEVKSLESAIRELFHSRLLVQGGKDNAIAEWISFIAERKACFMAHKNCHSINLLATVHANLIQGSNHPANFV